MSNQRKFIAKVVELLPELSSDQMQEFIDNLGKIKSILRQFEPTLQQFMEGQEKMELLQLHPTWDFMILRSKTYAEVGIAVSNHNEFSGRGWRLVFKRAGDKKLFTSPCCCCSWSDQLKPFNENEQTQLIGANLIERVCKKNGITTLLIHSWKNHLDLSEINCLDPHQDSWESTIDIEHFKKEFATVFDILTAGKETSLSSFLEKKG